LVGKSGLGKLAAGAAGCRKRVYYWYLPFYVRRTGTGYVLYQGMAIRHKIKEKRDRFGNIGKGLEDVSGERYQRI
jgi:hypothetical protein